MSDRKMLITMFALVIILALLIVLFYNGCATAKTVPNSEFDGPQCQTLLNQRDGLIWASAFGSGLTGIGGLSTAISDNKTAQLSIGISTAIIGALTSSLIVISKVKSNEFEQYCNQTIDLSEIEYDYQIKDGGK